MSDEFTPIEDIVIEDETVEVPEIEAMTVPEPVQPSKSIPKKERKRTVKKAVSAVAHAPKKAIDKVVEAVIPKKEEVEVVVEDPDAYYPTNTCWLCKRLIGNGKVGGGHINLISGNGFFELMMCGDCQRRFRKR